VFEQPFRLPRTAWYGIINTGREKEDPMNYLITCTLSALLAAGLAGTADAREQTQQNAATSGERNVVLTAASPCALARAVTEQLGRLAPQVKPLPNTQAFAAANGSVKVVVACGMSADETYTYKRLLFNLGIGLLSFRGDEPPAKVVPELADWLKLSYQQGPPSQLPLTYVFPGQGPKGQGVRITIQTASPAPARTLAPAAAPARAAAPAPAPARPQAPARVAPAPVYVPAPPRAQVSTPAMAPPAPLTAQNIILAPAPATSSAGKPGSENLFDLYLMAKANDPDLGRSQARYLASQADSDVTRASLHPHVNADFGLSWINQSTYNLGPVQNSAVSGYNYDITASVPILHFPVYYNLASVKATERSEELGVVTARQNLIFKLGQAYFGVLKARGDEQIARDEISRVRQALEQAQAFLKAGTGDIIAVYEAQARLDSVLADLNRSESTLNLAEQKLSAVVGKMVTSIEDYLLTQPKDPEPNDLDWWLDTMEKKDPQIRQAQEGLESTAQLTKSARSEHLPVIDGNAGFDVSKGAAFAPNAETRQWHVGAVITLPIYSGGETRARVRRAVANETERRYALDQVREQRRENLKQAFFNLRYNVSLIKALEQKEASALLQLNATKKGRSIGTRTAIDLLNGEQAYSVAQRDLKNALYDNVLRVLELKAAAGTLAEDDIAMSPTTATPAAFRTN
jgi:outer membrane protein